MERLSFKWWTSLTDNIRAEGSAAQNLFKINNIGALEKDWLQKIKFEKLIWIIRDY